MESHFTDFPLRLVQPAFEDGLTDILIDLDHLRRLRLAGSTPWPIFLELKKIFHLLEGLGSARIEGNRTTLADYIETKIHPAANTKSKADNIRELDNLEQAIIHVEKSMDGDGQITHAFLRTLHHITVDGLEREGDANPGSYRAYSVSISGSAHKPPEPIYVQPYMDELIKFINRKDAEKYDLLKIALAHHRFAWIHPFGNGNGRVVRLLTYALFIKYGFRVNLGGRILNPTAVFCLNRDLYYAKLSAADAGDDQGLLAWCAYALGGVLAELKNIDRLTDYDFLRQKILVPALDYSRERQWMTRDEAVILRAAVEKKSGLLRAGDIRDKLPELNDGQRTYQLRKLVASGMLKRSKEGARVYTIGFTGNVLLRAVVKFLVEEKFIPAMDNQDAP